MKFLFSAATGLKDEDGSSDSDDEAPSVCLFAQFTSFFEVLILWLAEFFCCK